MATVSLVTCVGDQRSCQGFLPAAISNHLCEVYIEYRHPSASGSSVRPESQEGTNLLQIVGTRYMTYTHQYTYNALPQQNFNSRNFNSRNIQCITAAKFH